MLSYDLIIIGAGISGMTAAIGAAKSGVKKILIIERETNVGGIINQCIHNGFGEKFLGNEVTGPEYIDYLKSKLDKLTIEIILNTTVLDVNNKKIVTYVNSKDGVKDIKGNSIIFATGAREQYVGNSTFEINRVTGIFTIGEAHRIVNLEGYLPGKNTIILAKDKWAFIVARRLIIEGGAIAGVILDKKFEDIKNEEIENIIDGFQMPIIENSKIISIDGKTRIEKVKILDLTNNSISNRECDSLLMSVNFVPENYMLKKLNLNKINSTDELEKYEIYSDGFFACGNIIYGDKALYMKETDGIECGLKAAEYIKEAKND